MGAIHEIRMRQTWRQRQHRYQEHLGADDGSGGAPLAGQADPRVCRASMRAMTLRIVGACVALFAAVGLVVGGVLALLGPLRVLRAGAAAEVLFCIVYCFNYWRMARQPRPAHMPRPSTVPGGDVVGHGLAVFRRFVEGNMPRYIDIRAMVSKWYWGLPPQDVTRGHVADLLAYGFLYSSREQLAARGYGGLVDDMVAAVEAAWGTRFLPEGEHGDGLPRAYVTAMRHRWGAVSAAVEALRHYLGRTVVRPLARVLAAALSVLLGRPVTIRAGAGTWWGPNSWWGPGSDSCGAHVFPGGSDPFMAHLWQGVRCHYRPLCFYLGTEFVVGLTSVVLLAFRFKQRSHAGGWVTRVRPTHALALTRPCNAVTRGGEGGGGATRGRPSLFGGST